jgi:hypothetical protein
MKITYIYHSGFIIEYEKATIIVDYFKDSADEIVHRSLSSFPGKLYVISSHWHPDHFNKEVLKWKNERPDIQYIFSKDILKKRLATPNEADYMIKGDVWQDENIKIIALGSTDVGISFLIETESKKIFHAGDLNNWHWDEESTPAEIQSSERHFLQEIKALYNETIDLDAAMFPVDCRLGKNYMRGAEQFVDLLRIGIFIPMHFGDTYYEANAFKKYAGNAGCKFFEITKTGDSITL